MMHYLDTNILIYSSVNQDPAKMDLSQSIVQELFNKDKLLLSPLSLQELIFTLFKLNINIESIEKTYSLFNQFCQYEINRDIMDSAFEIASKTNFGKNINDIIHLKFAEKYCSKLLTFDKDLNLARYRADFSLVHIPLYLDYTQGSQEQA